MSRQDEVAPLNSSTDATKVDSVNVRPIGRWAPVALGLSAIFVHFVGFTGDAAYARPFPQAITSVSVLLSRLISGLKSMWLKKPEEKR